MKRVLAFVFLALLTHAAQAQPWPSQPVRLVVPASPGSSLDVIARVLGEHLRPRWKEPVVVEDKAGAGGMLGMNTVARAAADGHTLGIGFNGPIAFAPHLYRHMSYEPAKDLVPVVLTTSQPNVLAVAASHPANSVAEFVAWAKQQGGKLLYASVGTGSSSHLTMELFQSVAGFEGTHVPYKGSPEAAMSVVTGETHAIFAVEPALLPFLQSKQLKLLASTGKERAAGQENLPTLAESGYPEVQSLAWNGLFAPAGTPAAVVEKINADVNAALAELAVRAVLLKQGLVPGGGTPADFQRLVQEESRKWGPLIEAKIKPID
ncbi:MAG: tripartite tricarboxylate transporter substrate binding protein [Hyphomicrobiales bacterium]|nr:tripartite tricarboxylate transporter substrate binding protein [Hyphomicrobiales bacterium]